MRVTSSLTNRIFLACTLLATLPLGVAFYLVSARAASEVQAGLRRNLAETAVLVDERWATLTGTYTTFARLIADLPKLKAAVETLNRASEAFAGRRMDRSVSRALAGRRLDEVPVK